MTYIVHVRGAFLDAVLYAHSGGVNELECAEACTSRKVAMSLKNKADAKLARFHPNGKVPDVTLNLTEDEAMCLAVAAQNCAFDGLPVAQRKHLEEWHRRWCQSHWVEGHELEESA